MTLLKKISGIRGTIGGKAGDSLSPLDIVEMSSAFGELLKRKTDKNKIVVGRDARISGEIVSNLSISTLRAMGFDIIDLGLSTTPTVEVAVDIEKAAGGIIFTASHNPRHWNALKLLNEDGEFISAEDGQALLEIAESEDYEFASVDELGDYSEVGNYIEIHINKILGLDYIKAESISSRNFKIVVDCINSTGAKSIAPLLDRLNCSYILINAEMTGEFAHNPEPLPDHLTELSEEVKKQAADLGIAVDPDVDRLVLVCEDGSMFGEEYTIVAAADYLLSKRPGPAVSNMSSSRALADIAEKYGQKYYSSPVGEVHVVNKMKQTKASIGGEGNGGVILPDLHYGRDALAGIALILMLLSERKTTLSELKKTYPRYVIHKTKYEIDPALDLSGLLKSLKNDYINEQINEEDGMRIDFDKAWVHLRKSNTEPVIRLIAEAPDNEMVEKLIKPIEDRIKNMR